MRTRGADAIVRERSAGQRRVRGAEPVGGLLDGPEAKLEGLNMRETRRGVLSVDAITEHVLDDRLRAAVEARDKVRRWRAVL
eukprot:3447965-Rhodomonas_salina.1